MANTFARSNIAVITAITGSKDKLLEAPKFESADYYLFTDDCVEDTKGWTQFMLPRFSNLSRPDRRNAKIPKVMPFLFLPHYEYVIWQDGGHMVVVDPADLIEKYLTSQDKDVAAFMHGKAFAGQQHDCVFKEAGNIKHVGFLEDPNIIDEQVLAYRKEGMPANYGLSCNAAMMWRNEAQVGWLQLTWWEQICRYSSRDQMSFFYSLWKTNMKDRFGYIDGHWERNQEIPRLCGHLDPKA